MADRVGQQLGDYRLIRSLGTGSFGEVYLGEHIYLQTQAAIKVLHAQLEADELQGFLNEARRVATLNHAHIVRLLGFSVEKGTPFMVMQLAPRGTLLRRYPRKQRFPIETLLPHVQQVAEGLQYAHDRKIIHLDIKPENMLLGEQDEVLLSDFGVAVVLQQTKSHLTVRGFSGTAVYAAPEQFQNQVGPASDQYALGVVVYEWLSGERPFFGGSLVAIGMAKARQPPPPLRDKAPSIAPAVEQVVLKALARDPRDRYPSVRAFAEALTQASKPLVAPPVRQRTPAPDIAEMPAGRYQPRSAPAPVPPVHAPESGLRVTPVKGWSGDLPKKASSPPPIEETWTEEPMEEGSWWRFWLVLGVMIVGMAGIVVLSLLLFHIMQ